MQDVVSQMRGSRLSATCRGHKEGQLVCLIFFCLLAVLSCRETLPTFVNQQNWNTGSLHVRASKALILSRAIAWYVCASVSLYS